MSTTTHSPVTATKAQFALLSAVLVCLSIGLKAWQAGILTPEDVTAMAAALFGPISVYIAPNLLTGVTTLDGQLPTASNGGSHSSSADTHQPGTASS